MLALIKLNSMREESVSVNFSRNWIVKQQAFDLILMGQYLRTEHYMVLYNNNLIYIKRKLILLNYFNAQCLKN